MSKDFKEIITNGAEETVELGKKIAQEIKGGEIICLEGDLGAGKTTFSQGLLGGLGVIGAVTSPTFLVMKQYDLKKGSLNFDNVYHIDTYRIGEEDILNLGWEEIIKNKRNIILLEWPEKIKKIIPENAIWIKFEILDEEKRKMIFS